MSDDDRFSGGVTRRQFLVRGSAAAGVAVLGGSAAALITDGGDATDPGRGSWSELVSLGDVAPVHASLLPTGEVLMCGTSGGTSGDAFPNFVIDPDAQAPVEVAPMRVPMRERDDTLFCAGHAFLADGRVLEVGGQRPSPELGLRYALIFDRRGGATGRWSAIGADILGGPSWYRTVTRLADGKMLIISGFIDWGGEVNRTIQLFDPDRFDRGRSPWTMLVPHDKVPDVSPTGADYTHVFVLPRPVELEGNFRQVVMMGASGVVHFFNHADPFTDPTRRFATRPNGRRPASTRSDRPAEGASSVMLADGRILIVGGGDEGGDGDAALMSKADIYDPYRDRWRSIETGVARSHPVAVMLPDGTVAVVNGDGSPGDPRKPQIIDPDSGAVTTGPAWPDNGVRGYHNVALLLADGKVLTGSGESSGELSGKPGGPGERTDIRHYSPPYLSVLPEEDRPSIVAADPQIEYGGPFRVRHDGGPINRVTLVAPGSMTHSIDMNQRCVVLFDGEAGEGELAITAPRNPSIAPPATTCCSYSGPSTPGVTRCWSPPGRASSASAVRSPRRDSVANVTPLARTRSICPRCRSILDAELLVRDDRVVLSRTCPDHGRTEAVVYGDAGRYREIQRFNKPGTRPLERQTEVKRGCPHDCGICPEHAQHTCLGIIEVNTACNLDCPICFAESGTGQQEHGYSLSLDQVESMLDAFVRAEGEPESVQLSGGEPSIHPQILEMLAAAKRRGIQLVMLNTNGIRLARDPRFAPALAELGVHVYLQFDGFEEATQVAIRGKQLTEEKLRALDRCAEAGASVSLAAAVERRVNEHEVGAILRFGVQHPAVTGVFFQPVTHSGRFRVDSDPLDKLTNSDVIDSVCAQLPEWFRHDDFVPVPCCSPSCRSATFALYDGHDLVPLPRLVEVEQYLDYVTNRAVPDLAVREALEGLWSAKAAGGSQPVAERLDCVACATGMPPELRDAAARGFMVVVQDFQDPYTLDVEKLRKCCVSEIVPDGRLIPFCAYNSVGYRERVRRELSSSI